MKIALLGGRGIPAKYGGFETAIEEIGARLAERGHEVSVYCRRGYGDDPGSEYRGMRPVFMPSLKHLPLETLSHSLLALIHCFFHAPDVLIVVNPANGPLCILPRLRGTPFAIHVDGMDWKRGKWPAIGRFYIRSAAWFCTKIAPEIIADSHAIADFYRQEWRRETYYASYGAFMGESTRPEVLEEYGVSARDYNLIIARLEPENHTDLLIDAFLRVKTDKKLVIVGDASAKDGAFMQGLRERAGGERVTLLGAVYDRGRLHELLCNCFAYLHGHSVGGTNPVLLEAMGCNACVVYLDVPFNSEVVGDAGLPFALDADVAATAMQAVEDDPARAIELREAARARVESAYSWEVAADAYEALCARLAGKRGENAD